MYNSSAERGRLPFNVVKVKVMECTSEVVFFVFKAVVILIGTLDVNYV